MLPEQTTEFEAFRVALKRGNTAALAMALQLCLPKKPRPDGLELVPTWLVQAAIERIKSDSTVATTPRAKGRHAREQARHLDDTADLLRAHCLLVARSEGLKGDAALEAAAEKLRGTFAATTSENLYKAYRRFARRCRTEPERYASLAIEVPEFMAMGKGDS